MLRNLWRFGPGQWCQTAAAALLILSAGLLGLSPSAAQAKGPPNEPAVTRQVNTIGVSQLPPQGQGMLALIYQGGPFRYDKDGMVFGNREKTLPRQNRGYYREYTVKTPSERTRGARRIICGGLKPAAPDVCYYTDDHYASFRKIVQ
jgi:ribonuclease T1